MATVHSHSASPIGTDGVVRCYQHGLKAVKRTSQTAANPGRQFYCCSKDVGDNERCKFFYWADDPMFQREPPVSPNSSSPSTPTRQRTQSLSSQRSPNKRPLSQSSPSPANMTPSQKRLAKIQEAVGSGKSSPTQKDKNPSQKQIHSQSQIRDDEIEELEFWASPEKDDIEPSSYKLPKILPVTRSPKRPRLFDPIESGPSDNEIEIDMLLTPPRSSQKGESSASGKYMTQNKTKGKEKEAQSIEWQNIQDNMLASSLRVNTTPINQSQRAPIFSSGSGPGRTDPTAASISSAIEELALVPDYVRKLERRRLAAEKSNEAKARKIVEMESEIAQLRTKIRVLEETVGALRVRR